jgi:hypothetical protein
MYFMECVNSYSQLFIKQKYIMKSVILLNRLPTVPENTNLN